MSGTAPEPSPDVDPVAALVRDHDPDAWAASLFWPSDARPAALSLLALDVELTRIPDIVSEPMLGEIRMQWWQDAITAGNAGGHPVATALLATIDRHNLDRDALTALIAAHQTGLYGEAYADINALDVHLDITTGTLFRALARVLAPGRVPARAIDPAARAYGLTQQLRRLPQDIAHGRHPLPRDVLDRFGVPLAHFDARTASPAVRLVIGALIAHAHDQFAAMTTELRSGGAGLAALLPAFLCPAYLRILAAPRFDLFTTPATLAQWRRLWILWRAARGL